MQAEEDARVAVKIIKAADAKDLAAHLARTGRFEPGVDHGPPTHGDRCAEYIAQKLPPSSFVLTHTDPESFPDGERSGYRVPGFLLP